MSAEKNEIVFDVDSWMVVETRAEDLGQQPLEYVAETISLGLLLANTYWEHKVLGYDTHLMLENGPRTDSFDRFNIDFKDVANKLEKPGVGDLPADPFAAEHVRVEIDEDQHEAVVYNALLLGVATRSLSGWFFNVRRMIDASFAEGSRVYMNHQDISYQLLRFADENQASN